MAKELPYFQFEPAEYLTKDISFCSLSAQGLFINLCSYYWQRNCKLTVDQLLRRLDHKTELEELIDEGVIDIEMNAIKVKFLDDQFEKATSKSKTNSINGSKGGRPRKEKPTETEIKPNQNRIESESKGIREDKIRRDKIKEEEIRECYEKILSYFPDNLKPSKPSDENNWLDTIDKLNRIDKIKFSDIELIVKTTRNDDFWSRQFLSLTKLRKKNKDGVMYIQVFIEQFKNKQNGITEKKQRGISNESLQDLLRRHDTTRG